MATDNHNSWVEYDVAIEVIGKMIAEQNKLRNKLLSEADWGGMDEADEVVFKSEDYIRTTNRISELRQEIQCIYKGKNLPEIFDRVKNVYVPILRERYGVTNLQVTS